MQKPLYNEYMAELPEIQDSVSEIYTFLQQKYEEFLEKEFDIRHLGNIINYCNVNAQAHVGLEFAFNKRKQERPCRTKM